MFQAKKVLLSLAVVIAAVSVTIWSHVEIAQADGGASVSCLVDVVVESRNQSGVLVGTELYHKEFVMQESESFFDDFSTRIRFKFFSASLSKLNGDKTIAINWFADVSVFNSVDFNTTVTLADGQKSGKSAADNTVYTSNGSTTTRFSMVCVEN
jgi:hypothetical protein